MAQTPSTDDQEELILSARYGDIDDVKAFVENFGVDALVDARDESGNTVLHMTCANGHEDTLEYLLPIIPPSLLSIQNRSGSTALHWAALNSQLPTIKSLIAHPTGPRGKLVNIKNNAGRTPLGEAEMEGWDEGAAYLVSVMDLDDEEKSGAVGEGATDEVVDDADADGQEPMEISVEVEDAEGGVSRMTIGADGKTTTTTSTSIGTPSGAAESNPST